MRCPTTSCPPPPRGTTAHRPRAPGPTATRSRRPASPRRGPRSRRWPGSLDLPVENLLTPDYLRRVLWQPPADGAAAELERLGARPWQVELTAGLLDEAIAAHPSA